MITPGVSPEQGAPRRGLRHLGVSFWRYATAYSAMSLADGVRFAAMPLLAASITRAPVEVAAVAFAETLPWLLVNLPSGVIVDRLDRRVVMEMAGLVRAALLAVLITLLLLHLISIPILIGLGFLLGSTTVFGTNASIGLVRSLVETEQLETANSVVGGVDSVASTLVGPAIGAALFVLATILPFGVDAVAFLLAVALLHGLQGDFRANDRSDPGSQPGLLPEMRAGVSWLWHHRVLRTLAVIIAASNLAFGMVFGILVLYALEVLHLPQGAYGGLIATIAVGGLAGAGLGARLGPRLRRPSVLFIALALQGVALAAAALWPLLPVVIPAMVLVGLSFALWDIVVVSYRQRVVPDAILGRVTSAFRVVGIGADPVGALLGGGLSQWLGLRAPFLVGAVVVAAALLFAVPMLGPGALD